MNILVKIKSLETSKCDATEIEIFKKNSEREKEVIDLRIFLSTLNGFVSSISGVKLERTKAKLCLSGLDSIDRFVKEEKHLCITTQPYLDLKF